MTVRRLKTYTAQTGYVYQYYFVGKRPVANEPPATEYVFDISSDRQSYFAVSILLQETALSAWADAHGRALSEAEQYAIGKMALFQAFDDVPAIATSEKRFFVTPENIQTFAEALNLE